MKKNQQPFLRRAVYSQCVQQHGSHYGLLIYAHKTHPLEVVVDMTALYADIKGDMRKRWESHSEVLRHII